MKVQRVLNRDPYVPHGQYVTSPEEDKDLQIVWTKGKDGQELLMVSNEAKGVSLGIGEQHLKGVAPRKELILLFTWLDAIFCERHRTRGSCLCYVLRQTTNELRHGPGGLRPGSKANFAYLMNDYKKFNLGLGALEARCHGVVSWVDNKFRVYIPVPEAFQAREVMQVIQKCGSVAACRLCLYLSRVRADTSVIT